MVPIVRTVKATLFVATMLTDAVEVPIVFRVVWVYGELAVTRALNRPPRNDDRRRSPVIVPTLRTPGQLIAFKLATAGATTLAAP